MREAVKREGILKAAYSKSFAPNVNDVYSTFTSLHTSTWGTANSYIWNKFSGNTYNNPYYGAIRGQFMYR